MLEGNRAELLFGLAAEDLGQFPGMSRKILEQQALLIAVALDAPCMIEQAGIAAKTQTIETGENKQDQRLKAR